MRSFFFLITILLSSHLYGQGVPIGQWRSHLPYKNVTSISENKEEVFCGTTGGLFTIRKSTGEITKYSTLDGFSYSEISALSWNPFNNKLLIAYSNSNLDVLEDGKVSNYPEIFNKNIPGKKSINAICFQNELAYLSTSFGIVVYNLDKREVKDTYNLRENGIDLEILEIAMLGNSIFATTNSGVYEANIGDNLFDFSRWKKHGLQEFYPLGVMTSLVNFGNYIYGLNNNVIYRYNGLKWEASNIFGPDVKKLKVNNGNLIAIAPFRVIVYDELLNIKVNSQNIQSFASANDAVFNQKLYIADKEKGVVINSNSNYHSVFPQGPGSGSIKDLFWANGKLIVSPGSFSETNSPLYNNDGFSAFKNESWKTYSAKSYAALANVRDIVTSYASSHSSKVYLGSYVNGLIEEEDGAFKIFNQQNSTLQTTVGDAATIRISGLDEDSKGNLWVSQYGVTKPLSVKMINGEWKSYSFTDIIPGSFAEVTSLLVDEEDQKWLVVKNHGLIVFNSNFSSKIGFSETSNGLPGSILNVIEKDNNGSIWIGTNKGVAIIGDPLTIVVETPKIVENGFLRPLLAQENILAIAVDGANRKWVSSNNGVWLFNADGTKQEINFNARNSPLLHNRVESISIDKQSGEVFFGTNRGLISFKGDATNAVDKMGKIIVYPNPVRPNYKGEIGIKGLVDKARVKITDINGTLVYQAISNGGQATWNGKNFSGVEASSGVYLVLISSEDGSDTAVSKIMIIR